MEVEQQFRRHERIFVRFNADGSLDSGFGSSGIETGAGITAGLAMVTASNGETIMIGTPSSGSGIILQEFYSLTRTQTLYVEQDANYNVTSLTDANGNVAERYVYDPYGTVTVLNADGSVKGSGTLASSSYGSMYTFQGGRTDPVSGLVHFQYRDLNTGLGRWIEQDPAGYVNGPNVYQLEESSPVGLADPTGLDATTQPTQPTTQPNVAPPEYPQPDTTPVVKTPQPIVALTTSLAPGITIHNDRFISPAQAQLALEALKRVLKTERGKELLAIRAKQYPPPPIDIYLGAKRNRTVGVGGDNHLDPALAQKIEMSAYPNRPFIPVQGPNGPENIYSGYDRTLAHELGHAITGVYDDGPGGMNNVNQNENPISIELGLKPRTNYHGKE